jgi:hypothetical protein
MYQTHRQFGCTMVAAITMIGGLAGGCGDSAGPGSVSPLGVLVTDRSTPALVTGQLRSASGTYGAGCSNRSGNWSFEILAMSPLASPVLSVVRGNRACVLTLTSLTADQEYTASSSIDLTAYYRGTASSFAAGGRPAFHANAHLSALTFATDFSVSIVYSDDPGKVTPMNATTSAAVAQSASASGVPAPSYTIDMSPLLVQTDSADVVETATGTADLISGPITGQKYVVLDSLAALPTYADIDAAFKMVVLPTAIVAVNPQIVASDFALVGVDLTIPAVRYVIIANTLNDVPSYQLFTITFDPSP